MLKVKTKKQKPSKVNGMKRKKSIAKPAAKKDLGDLPAAALERSINEGDRAGPG